MNIGIVYTSLSGNTEETADFIGELLAERGHSVSSVNIYYDNQADENYNIENKDLLLIGSYTWGEGLLPDEMRGYLRTAIKDRKLNFPPVAVFGTGEKQWTYFCRAVDEIKYHLSKITKVFKEDLKIEQSPRGHQKRLAVEFVENILMEAE